MAKFEIFGFVLALVGGIAATLIHVSTIRPHHPHSATYATTVRPTR